MQVSGGTLAVTQSDTVGAVTLTSGTISGAGTLTGSSFAVQGGTVSAALGGSGATLTKTTAGSVSLTGNNTYTGLTDVQAGTLTLGRSGGRSPTALRCRSPAAPWR
ncbi:MAG: autotransporter-associated beta strand repeat-containing protein [Kiritimatiellia bacterium]